MIIKKLYMFGFSGNLALY